MKQEKIYLKDYTAPSFQVQSLKLDFNLYEDHCLVVATSKVQKTVADAIIELDGEDLELVEVAINGRPLTHEEYRTDKHFLRIPISPEQFELRVITKLKPHENTSLEGLYKSSGHFVTQCEAQGFRKITYFWDRPDVMTSYEVTIEADKQKYPVLLSNGDRLKVEELPQGRHRAYWRDPHKKPCYLFALFAGDLGLIRDSFVTASGRKVNLEVYAAHGKQDRCEHAMESLKKAMKWDEERFGREYDLNDYMIVAIDDFNAGAMENKGLNIFNSRLVLADKKTATDNDFFAIESVVAHEYFHNWTGNRVTLRDWFQLSLKEGLTVFRDQEFSADMSDRGLQRIEDVDSLRAGQFSEDAGPNAHPVRPESCMAVDNFFTMTIYEKGAEVIRMMQSLVGKKGFRKGMDLYFERFDGKAVTTEDFAQAIADANKADFSQFKLWYTQAGTPEVHVRESYDATKKQYTLELKQSCRPTAESTQKKPFHIPLFIALLDSKGQEMALQCSGLTTNSDGQKLIELKESQTQYVFENVNERPVLSLNREFSAPIKLNWEAKDEDLYFLMSFDSDSFNRREAAKKMTQQVLVSLIAKHEKGQALEIPETYFQAFEKILRDPSLDPAYKSKLLQPIPYSNLAQDLPILNAEAFQAARDSMCFQLASRFENLLLETYKAHLGDNEKHRKLKAVVLKYLSLLPQKHEGMIWQNYVQAQNMTDKEMGLQLLSHLESPYRRQALEDFYQSWQSEGLVLNKWFATQALASRLDTFKEVQELVKHPKFQIANPNNVYSLLRNFSANIPVFHSPQLDCYTWYADMVIQIDKLNPQVAARLCAGFNFTQKLPAAQKAKAMAAVEKILAYDGLSKNSKELLVTLRN
ncbi:MAG: aminopeptidase N [Bdellovibrionia bacterium]